MCNLAMQVTCLDDITIRNTQRAHASTGEVGGSRTAKAAGTDDKDAGGFEAFLAWSIISCWIPS